MAWKREEMMKSHVELTNADRLHYDSDPKALAWAHETLVDEAQAAWKMADDQGERGAGWKKYANLLAMRMIGFGEGCVISAFDHRLALHDAMLAKARFEIRQERNPDAA